MSDFQKLRSWSSAQGRPFTIGLVASLIVAMLAMWLDQSKALPNLALTQDLIHAPWTLVTYAWSDIPYKSGLELTFFVFLLMWLYSFAGSLEQEVGWKAVAAIWLLGVLIEGLVFVMGSSAVGLNIPEYGAYLPTSFLTMVWCGRNTKSIVNLYGAIPLSGKWLAAVDGGAVLLVVGSVHPVLGAMVTLPLVATFFVSLGRMPFLKPKAEEVHATRAQTRYKAEYYDEVQRREREREERERLRKLFESSLDDDN